MSNPNDRWGQPSVVMYGVGVSTTPQPGTGDWEEWMRRLRESAKFPAQPPTIPSAEVQQLRTEMLAALKAQQDQLDVLNRMVVALSELETTKRAEAKKRRAKRGKK